ncbi:homeobox-leucine zipper protein GLABRA 2 isoform X1 [Silene latifolia]|uniref:homeobox-leucine zipper protein GLABRA 2 isoform X1 n=1 Tax=Silene latifolia TaxID=37657 RepID=UPI003D76C689
MGVDMSNNNNNPPNNNDFFSSPALSLSLAGIFRGAAETPARSGGVEEGDEGSGGGGGGTSRRDDTVEISSENSGPVRSRSEDADFIMNNADDDDDNDDDDDGDGGDEKGKKKKKRKRYHRHTAEQIREMEALFKESPHPDEKQRQQLSKQLGLHPRQVKFWFQNRRTQIKAIQERHENSLLKTELEKLRDENKSLRDNIEKSSCPNCGFATASGDTALAADGQQQLRIENARLKAEVEKLKAMVGKYPPGAISHTATCPSSSDQESKSSLDLYTGVFGIDKATIMDAVNQALEELKKMALSGEPLWLTSVETGREILNYDEYLREVCADSSSGEQPKRSIEASRESRVVFVDLPKLVQSFMDVNQWKEMFPSLISKAAVVDVICIGEDPNRNGAVQLMYAELQMLTPMVPTREVYFVRYCKQLNAEQWAIVDVSIDKLEDNIDASLIKFRKRPSGCVIEDKSNGHCKVTWVEHLDCQKTTVHSLYRSMVNSGLAFGAKRWISTLQLQCERSVFLMATNVPTKDSSGVATLAGRKSILKLAQRMTCNFCRALGASSFNTWTKVTTKSGEDVKVTSRKNLNNHGEPIGVILCAVFSVWLAVSPSALFDFLRDDAHRHEWDVMAKGCQVKSIANLAKGQDRGNAVSIQTLNSKENMTWALQDSSTNTYESMVVYAPVDTSSIQSVMTGCDSSSVAVLPSGFSILPDGMESRSLVLTSRKEKNTEGGSLLTIAIQVVTNGSPTAKLTAESVEPVSSLILTVLDNIKRSLQCDDG